MVISGTPYLITDTFLDVVVKKICPLLSLGWYLFAVVNHNGYLTRDSNGNVHSITMNGNVSVASWAIPFFGNNTISRFCQDSLNLLNSVKFI